MSTIDSQTTFSVSELNRKAKSLLELHLNQIWVEGEVSNLSQPGSGHWYFTLKDEKAQIRCAMFRNRNLLVKTRLKAGDLIKVRARVSLYEPRGDYQLIAEFLEPAGEGALQQKFEQLKKQLADEGLFDHAHKKAIPSFIQKLAVISSATGAALQDILQILKRRNPAIEVIVVPSIVQGDTAPQALQYALHQAINIDGIDAIIIGRGGGSLEDLWAFNDETLARQIFQCPIPIISAVGHEIDFSICDFVADLRAPTPSAAAELVSFDQENILNLLQSAEQRLSLSIKKQLSALQKQTLNLGKRLKHPGDRINQWQQRTDYCAARLLDTTQKNLTFQRQQLALLTQSLHAHSPEDKINECKTYLASTHTRLIYAMQSFLEKKQLQLAKTSNALDIVSPLATLKRGYTIVKAENGSLLHSANDVNPQQTVNISFHDGEATAKVTDIRQRESD